MQKISTMQTSEKNIFQGQLTASLVSPVGIPRPTIADFLSGTYGANTAGWPGSLAEMSVPGSQSPATAKRN
jgi:hypothetical protein